jgi:peptidoglycan/LPS O-acetylase OafA/YrhL
MESTPLALTRIGLSLSVLFVHVVAIADHSFWYLLWTTWFGPFERSILPAFFILSGYLVCGSLIRNSVRNFIALRAIRIFPALAVEITLSALVIGPIFTVLPIPKYVSSHEFYSYFLNIA